MKMAVKLEKQLSSYGTSPYIPNFHNSEYTGLQKEKAMTGARLL